MRLYKRWTIGNRHGGTGGMSDFDTLLAEVETLLRERKRLSYTGLKQRFQGDSELLEAVRDELVYARQVARDENGKVLVWQAAATQSARQPLDYTPRHLADKILNRRSAIEGERKRVTILFTDIKGSQQLAEELGPEAWHEVLDRFFSILSEGIHRYEGTINQYTGDGVMALFGAPIAHEDHALRACLASLDLQAALREFGDELRLKQGVNLSVRVGINSGEVIVGSIGDDLRMDYTAQGHSVGLAARMEQICEPGHIFLTENTARQVSGYVQLRDLGEMQVKGSSEPLHVFDLEGMGALRTRLDASRARGLSRFVGRERESRLLDDALSRAIEGDMQVVGVIGNGGVGKSRLCFELIERARGRGVEVCQGTGVPYASAVPFHPVKSLLSGAVGIEAEDSPLEARRKIAGSLAMAGITQGESAKLVADFLSVADPGERLEIPPEAREHRLFEVVVDLLTHCNCPMLVLIEDLHWIDAGSEAFLKELIVKLKGSKIMLLLNYRPEYVADWLVPIMDLELPLSALGEKELGVIADELLGSDASVQPVRQDIIQRAGGNPFFVEEAIRSLAEAGHLEGARGAYVMGRALDKLLIPDSVQEILAARIDRLGDAEKRVLQHAAVIGKGFSATDLCQLLEEERAQVSAGLQELEEAGFVNSADGEQYDFCHPMTQEVAYKAQLSAARAKMHARYAGYLESQVSNPDVPDEQTVQIAHHLERGGEALRAAEWHLKAAIWFIPRDARATFDSYRKARDLVDEAGARDDPKASHLAIAARAGMVRSALLGRVDDQETEIAYQEARQIVEKTGDRAGLAELMISNGGRLLNTGDSLTAFQNVTEAMGIARELGDIGLQARFRIPILLAAFAAGRLQQGLDLLEEPGPVPWYQQEVDLMNVGGRAFRALMLSYQGRLAEAAVEMGRCIDVARNNDRRISWLFANRVELAHLSGDLRLAASDAATAFEFAEDYGAPLFRVVAGRAVARNHLFRNEPQAAIVALERDLPLIDKGAPAHQFEVAHLVTWAEALILAGEAEESIDMARRAVRCGEENKAPIWTAQGRMALARQIHADAPREAHVALDLAQREIETSGAITLMPLLLETRSRLLQQEGKLEAAGNLLNEALIRYREVGADGHLRRLQSGRDIVAEIED